VECRLWETGDSLMDRPESLLDLLRLVTLLLSTLRSTAAGVSECDRSWPPFLEPTGLTGGCNRGGWCGRVFDKSLSANIFRTA